MPPPPTPSPSYIPQRSALPSSQSRSRLRLRLSPTYLRFTEDSRAHSSGLAGDQRAASSMRFPSSAGHAPGASASYRLVRAVCCISCGFTMPARVVRRKAGGPIWGIVRTMSSAALVLGERGSLPADTQGRKGARALTALTALTGYVLPSVC